MRSRWRVDRPASGSSTISATAVGFRRPEPPFTRTGVDQKSGLARSPVTAASATAADPRRPLRDDEQLRVGGAAWPRTAARVDRLVVRIMFPHTIAASAQRGRTMAEQERIAVRIDPGTGQK